MIADKPKWKRFEDLAAQIQKTLSPGASVEQNVKIPGQRSGVLREIDISVRTQVGQYDLFVAIDCKDYRRAVNVKDVEAFIGLVDDVGANKGALVAAHGFSKAAKQRATRAGIDVFQLVDAEAHEWRTYATMPMVVSEDRIESVSFCFSATGPIEIPMQDFRTLMVYHQDGRPIDCLNNLVAKLWNADKIPHDPGLYENLPLTDEATYLPVDSSYEEVLVTATVKTRRLLYFGQQPLSRIKGFRDEATGATFTRSIQTDAIVFSDVEKDWQQIASLSDLAVQVTAILHVSSLYPVVDIDRPGDTSA